VWDSTYKTLCLSYYCLCFLFFLKFILFYLFLLCFLFNKIGEKGRTGSAWKREGGAETEGGKAGGRNDPNNVCTYE
jgi:hypothetical protein